jgi:cation:H+ antiporter
VAIGTSLPEIATSVVASRKKKPDIAIGNIVWSNIFNILRVLWLTATIHPLTVPSGINRDIGFAIFATTLLLIFPLIKKKFTLHRYQGFIMIITYVVYLIIVFSTAK